MMFASPSVTKKGDLLKNRNPAKSGLNVGSENVHKEGPGSTPNSGPGEKVPEDMSSGSSSGGTGNSNESVKPYAG